MYSALRDRKGIGSTRLHMDVAPTFNVLAHAESQGCATWQIFARKDADPLAVWMRERYKIKGHPVHQQQVYLTKNDLADLWNEIQIRPYTIHQRQNHIMLIPPGCPHQVGQIIRCMMCTRSLSICSRLATRRTASKPLVISSFPTILNIAYGSLPSFVRKISLKIHGWWMCYKSSARCCMLT